MKVFSYLSEAFGAAVGIFFLLFGLAVIPGFILGLSEWWGIGYFWSGALMFLGLSLIPFFELFFLGVGTYGLYLFFTGAVQ